MKIKIELDEKTIEILYPLALNNRFKKGWGEDFFLALRGAKEQIKKLYDMKAKGKVMNPYFKKKLLNKQ